MAAQQVAAVKSVLAELDIGHIPMLTVWNKVRTALVLTNVFIQSSEVRHLCVGPIL